MYCTCVCACVCVCVCVCVPLYEQYFLLYSLSHQKLLTPKAILFVILHNFFTHKTEEFQALMETEIVYSVLFRLLCMGQRCYMQKSESCWCHLCETMQTNFRVYVTEGSLEDRSPLKHAIQSNMGHSSRTVCCCLIVPERYLCIYSNLKKGREIHVDQDSFLPPSRRTCVSPTGRTLATATRWNQSH